MSAPKKEKKYGGVWLEPGDPRLPLIKGDAFVHLGPLFRDRQPPKKKAKKKLE